MQAIQIHPHNIAVAYGEVLLDEKVAYRCGIRQNVLGRKRYEWHRGIVYSKNLYYVNIYYTEEAFFVLTIFRG